MPRSISLQTAKAQYVHRFTMEHVPAWARKSAGDGKFYAPQFRTDAQWYENTTFPGEKDLPKDSDHCMTRNQSWPMGQWLDKPFSRT